jgi:hypothetical protein
LFSATSDVIVSDLIELFFVLPIDWLSLCEKHCIRGYDSELFWFCGYNFEFDWLEVSSNHEQVSLLDWSVGVFEIRYEISFGQITSDAFDGILKRKDMDFGQVWNFACTSDLDDISESDSEIFADCFVHSDFAFFQFIIN